jgi:hypothetical protein
MRPAGHPADGQRPRHAGRGLCEACSKRHRNAGDLEDVERTTRTRDELLTDYRHLAAEGHPVPVIADRLGVTRWAIYKARARAGA